MREDVLGRRTSMYKGPVAGGCVGQAMCSEGGCRGWSQRLVGSAEEDHRDMENLREVEGGCHELRVALSCPRCPLPRP